MPETTFDAFRSYVEILDDLVEARQVDPDSDQLGHRIAESLADGPAAALRQLVDRSTRRGSGTFFTGLAIRDLITDAIETYGKAPFLDPACGAGDLLLAAAQALPVATPQPTLRLWGESLLGTDIHAPLADAARRRLWLFAHERCYASGHSVVAGGKADKASGVPDAVFTRVSLADGISNLSLLQPFDGTIVMNPPFGSMPAPAGYRWGGGLVSRAAVFVDSALDAMAIGSILVAVLPDVLRSGSRTRRWRQGVLQRAEILVEKSLGQFDEHADVDVYLLVARRTEAGTASEKPNIGRVVDDFFHVAVGPVVDNRDPHLGPLVPYATARRLPRLGVTSTPNFYRHFAGRLHAPPFVLVRRTSRPSESARAASVVVTGSVSVAVDNHLIVATPHDGSVASCNRLAEHLGSAAATSWLNERIRCRHLTVGAVRELPYEGSKEPLP
ncbi:N-6 DNA methylase [Geodermatophilus sp. DSM 44513]|uniref:N-6 DNA methylase n=1 Tax=Geodermatophilus sp. DSM 44513 TaxID=1528104 RepID=UPI0014126053|nr:N-6 DNA methylase [Geodermatophilus sp. DSM 44513]WNV76707.1 N-6 DNA methylase [Geodermatophilus sp. DSM 44513]